MKKNIPIAIVAVTLIACKDEEKIESTKGTEEVAKTSEAAASTANASSDLPKFSTPDVKKFEEE